MIHTTTKKAERRPAPAGIYPAFYALRGVLFDRAGFGSPPEKIPVFLNRTPFLGLKTQVKKMKYSYLRHFLLNGLTTSNNEHPGRLFL